MYEILLCLTSVFEMIFYAKRNITFFRIDMVDSVRTTLDCTSSLLFSGAWPVGTTSESVAAATRTLVFQKLGPVVIQSRRTYDCATDPRNSPC